jgi:hypothetical protein
MKIYFTAAISQKDKFGAIYDKIIKVLEQNDHQVQHDHITQTNLDQVLGKDDAERLTYYKKALKWISQADVVVVEASFPSTLNIGHEVTLSLEKGKPVVMLYKQGFDSVFMHGLNSEKLFLVEYTEENLEQLLKDTVEYARDQSDTRFNFFISPRHVAYLDWVAQTKKIPRSVYLRHLLEKDRDKNLTEYTES